MRRRLQRPRLEICGGIAAGKTTLARLLQDAGFTPVLEEFHRNPFLGAFYSDPSRYAIETELSFLLQHFHMIKKTSSPRSVRACDFSFVLDHAYAKVTLSSEHQRRFRTVFRWVIDEIHKPAALIHLACPAEVELDRIRRRGRNRERHISARYLADLNSQLSGLLRDARTPILAIDSSAVNFATDKMCRQRVLQEIAGFARKARLHV